MQLGRNRLFVLILAVLVLESPGQSAGVESPPEYSEFTVRDCIRKTTASSAAGGTLIPAKYIMKGTVVWRTINLTASGNHELFATNNGCVQLSLIEVIKYGLLEKKLNAFHTDDFVNSQPISEQELYAIMYLRDSAEIAVIGPDGSETNEIARINRFIMAEDIVNYLLKEDWIINNHSGKLEKHIIAIAPLVRDRTEGLVIPLFWLYFREWAAFLDLFDTGYSGDKRSYLQLLEHRGFRSQISKISNLANAPIKSTRHGVDVLLESEIIKESVRNSESDLFQH